jgi:hypothetical protein
MRYLATAAVLLFIALPVIAADIDGKWTTTVDGMDGNKMVLTYTLSGDEIKLTTDSGGQQMPSVLKRLK